MVQSYAEDILAFEEVLFALFNGHAPFWNEHMTKLLGTDHPKVGCWRNECLLMRNAKSNEAGMHNKNYGMGRCLAYCYSYSTVCNRPRCYYRSDPLGSVCHCNRPLLNPYLGHKKGLASYPLDRHACVIAR